MISWLQRLFKTRSFYAQLNESLERQVNERRTFESERLRANYDFLRAEITKRHYLKQNGFSLDQSGRMFTIDDLRMFKLPMYRFVFDAKSKLCIIWDADKMTEEIGCDQPGGLVESGGQDAQSTTREILSPAPEAGV